MDGDAIVLLPVGALLLGIILELVFARILKPSAKGWLAFSASLVSLAGVILLLPRTLNGQLIQIVFTSWDGPVQFAYALDGLSQIFALIATGIGTIVLLYSVVYISKEKGATRFYALMLGFIAGFVNMVYSADLVLLYVNWEVIGLCSFLLVGFWFQNREAAQGARKVFVITHLAGYGLLAAVLLLYLRTGSTLWTDPRIASAFGSGLFFLVLIAAMAKSVQFPLHTWIPDAMAAPTPVSSLLHAACYVTAGIYLIARLYSLVSWSESWNIWVIWIGTITILIGALFAMIQSDLKRLLAFSTISQLGYMVLGLGLGTPLGLAAGLLHCLNHSLFKGGLFLCAGSVQYETGTRDMDKLGGVMNRMPRTTIAWMILTASIAGVPLFSGFVSKWLLFNAALDAGQVFPALIAWFVSVITIFYFLKATTGVFMGEETPIVEKAKITPRVMQVSMGLLSIGSIILGVFPQIAVRYLINPMLLGLGLKPVIGVTWFGLTLSSGSWMTTAGLILAIVSVGAGIIIYLLIHPGRQLEMVGASAGGVFSGGDPLVDAGRMQASDFSRIIFDGLRPFYEWLDVDQYYRLVWKTQLFISNSLEHISNWFEQRVIPSLVVLILCIALGVSILSPPGAIQVSYSGYASQWLLISSVGLAGLCLVITGAVSLNTRDTLQMAAVVLLSISGMLSAQEIIRTLLLESAAFVVIALVWDTAISRNNKRLLLFVIVVSAISSICGVLFAERLPAWTIFAFLFIGFVLKLAIVPLYVWLPRLAEKLPAVVLGLLVGVVDIAAFGELLALRQSIPELFISFKEIWLVLGVLSALGGAILMLAQKDIKRMLAFSTIEDMGCLLIGVALGNELGVVGATIGAAVHALAKSLLFISVSTAERKQPISLETRGLATNYPVAATGFLVGMITILGIPPFWGYAARWRLYSAAAELNWGLMALMLLASVLVVLAYARALAVTWWGPSQDSNPSSESPAIKFAIGIICIVLLISGLWPGLINYWL